MTSPAAASKPAYVARTTLTHDGNDYVVGDRIDEVVPAEVIERLLDTGEVTQTKPKTADEG